MENLKRGMMDIVVKCLPSAFKHGLKIMPDLTIEEYDALDEYWTVNTPRLSGNGKNGFFAKHAESLGHIIFIDDMTANWLRIKATAAHTTPEAIIRELVRKEIAAASGA